MKFSFKEQKFLDIFFYFCGSKTFLMILRMKIIYIIRILGDSCELRKILILQVEYIYFSKISQLKSKVLLRESIYVFKIRNLKFK